MTRPDLPAGQPPEIAAGSRPAVPARPHLVIDTAIAVAVTAAQLAGAHWATSWHPHHAPPGAATDVLLIVSGLALIARRRYPVAVLAVTQAAALAVNAIAGTGVAWIALIVAFFTAVLARKRAAAIASLIIGYLAAVWPPWLIGQPGHTTAESSLGLAAWLLFLLSVAELIRGRNQRAADAHRAREAELRRRASEERMQMARDLHDLVAHNISVINVQANTALHLMDRQPERARSALSTINDVSKQALVELRSVLGVLRGVDQGAPLAPSPSLSRLGDLVDTAAAAGLAVRIEESGPRAALPADIDLAAYRIVQEALTNSARHSGGTSAIVHVRYREHDLEVEVTDDGAVRPGGPGRPAGSGRTRPPATGSGHGIDGMTERASALGGTLRAGPRPGGGFGVLARLPLDGSGR